MGAICERGQAYQLGGAYRLAVRDYEECRARMPDDVRATLQLSWLLSTCPDAGVRDGRRALDLAAEVCDPVTCRSPEPLTALAAAYAELGDFARATKLQARAVAMSSFSVSLRDASVRRLRRLERNESVRETAPLRIQPGAGDGSIHAVTEDEAMSFPADVLGFEMLDVEVLLETCVMARAGATIHAALGGQPLTITAATVNAVEPRLRERRDVLEKVIRRRGFATLAEGYVARRRGDCDSWELGDRGVLVEQDGFHVRLAQGVSRHRAIVVESAVVLMHDSNTDVWIPGGGCEPRGIAAGHVSGRRRSGCRPLTDQRQPGREFLLTAGLTGWTGQTARSPYTAATSRAVRMPSENEFVAALLAGLPRDRRLEVAAGDDAAVLRPPARRRTVVTVDMLMEGVDFVLGPDCGPEVVGHKALAVSLSDLAAMGSRPEAAVVAVALPRRAGSALGHGVQAGLAAAAAAFDVALAGGDTNSWDGPLVISTTLLGSVAPGAAWRRDGACPGDLLVVSGACGGSLLGRHLAVTPRCREAAAIAAGFTVHAAIDVSDGLSLDLARMMEASGTAAVLDLDAVPIHPDAVEMAGRPGDGRTPLEHALGDGEDFELVLAMPREEARRLVGQAGRPPLETPFTIIGEVVAGQGLFARMPDGRHRPLAPRGYEHDLAG